MVQMSFLVLYSSLLALVELVPFMLRPSPLTTYLSDVKVMKMISAGQQRFSSVIDWCTVTRHSWRRGHGVPAFFTMRVNKAHLSHQIEALPPHLAQQGSPNLFILRRFIALRGITVYFSTSS